MSTSSSFPSTSSSTLSSREDTPPWSKFTHWIHSICVVTFDLELGQALEVIYPGDAVLSAQEKSNICYLAFPDSNSGSNTDTKYHFRIRRGSCEMSSPVHRLLLSAPPALPVDAQFLYGFVHFRQQRAPSLPRGYYQKSVVVISILPFFHLFSTVVEKVALGFFEMGEPAIEAACHDVDQWPVPCSGVSYQLPLMGTVIQCRLPSACDAPLSSSFHNTLSSEGVVCLQTVYEQDLYKSLSTLTRHVQLLWELVLIGEPLLVIAPSPTRAAAVVQSLVALVAPIRYGNDFRPYFTIHDSEFREYTGKAKNPARVMLGVTNPFFVKALDHWPHILKVNEYCEGEQGVADTKQEKARKTWDGKTLDNKPGLFTNFKPFLHRDENLIKKLSKDRPDDVHSSVLQRHFLELTQSFMIPLERYLASLMPLRKQMSPFKSIPAVKPFIVDDFVSTLDDAGPSLTCGVKGDWTGLYRRFVLSSSFVCWLSSRLASMKQQVTSAYVDALCEAELGKEVLAKKHHVEIVDLVLRIRHRVLEVDVLSPRRASLISQIRGILEAVDDDLKSVLTSNCSLRDILA